MKKIICGTDRIDEFSHLFVGKRIGLITNPSGVRSDYVSTADYFYKNYNLVAMYSPEHGVRGDAQAGAKIDSYMDQPTGVTVYSVYGEKRYPSN
ncbi:MAG: DUF1343 domain-containing protein, partial [Oscillospiraceae bacterium]